MALSYKKVPLDYEYEVTDDEQEIDVEVHYNCFISDNVCFSPMSISGSIWKGYTLQDFVKQGRIDYEKSYKRVTVKAVFIDV